MKASPFSRVRAQISKACKEAHTAILVLNGGEAEIHFQFGFPVHAALATEALVTQGIEALKNITKYVSLPVKISWVDPVETEITIEDCDEETLLNYLADPVSFEQPVLNEVLSTTNSSKIPPLSSFGMLTFSFPTLPQGKILVPKTSVSELSFSEILESLPNSIAHFFHDTYHGILLIEDGKITDGVFLSEERFFLGEMAKSYKQVKGAVY